MIGVARHEIGPGMSIRTAIKIAPKLGVTVRYTGRDELLFSHPSWTRPHVSATHSNNGLNRATMTKLRQLWDTLAEGFA